MAVSLQSFAEEMGKPMRAEPPKLDEADLVGAVERGEADGQTIAREISWSAVRETQDSRLVGCSVPSPTCADVPETPRLEFAEFQRRAGELAREFFCSRDCEGMVASIAALQCISFHDELVALLLRSSMDRKDAEREAVVRLLNALATEGLLSGPQLARGFEKLILGWDDLQLDVPDAPGQIASLLSAKVGLLDKALFARLPEGLLRRLHEGVSPGSARDALGKHLHELVGFKAALEEHLAVDLFRDQSLDTFTTWLRQAQMPAFHHEVVLASCLGSVSAGAALAEERQRLVLALTEHLMNTDGGPLLTDVDVQMGFSRLLGTVRDAGAEVPLKLLKEQAVGILRGAVQHELLPAEFLKSAKKMRFGGVEGVEVLRQAQRQTPMHSRRVWGSGDERHFQTEVREAILEYFDSNSAEELGTIVEELHLSDVEQVRFIRKLMVTGMERGDGDSALDAVSALLARCWTLEEVRLAFEQLRDIAQDLVLDLPKCREQTSDLVWAAVGRGLLEKADLINDAAASIV